MSQKIEQNLIQQMRFETLEEISKLEKKKRLNLDEVQVVKTASDFKRLLNEDGKLTQKELDQHFTPEVIANEKAILACKYRKFE